MEISIDDARLNEVLKSARNCRMRQLESDFAVWEEYTELVDEKDRLLKSLEKQVTGSVWEVLQLHDDFNSLMVCKAQDYFYSQGFEDCISLIKLFLGEVPLPKAAQTT